MSTDQLRLIAFHRLVKLNGTLNESVFLAQLTERFEVTKQPGNCPVIPAEARTFGMYFRGTWYRLRFTDTCGDTNPVSELDVSILQECLLAPVLHISDPRTDPGLQVAGGFTPVENLVEWVDKGDYTVVFTLFPTSIDQLIRVADAGEVMPPKSTWFEPKFPAGLLIHTVD
jgi:uncharacterized protein (DUF1015 family)